MGKILIITNHSYMLYRFRRELIQKLAETNVVVLSMPFVGHEEDFQAMGLRCIPTEVDRRGINPITDLALFHTYRRLLKQEQPDMVITYSIKPNIYAGLACSMANVPYFANVQGLGTVFQKSVLAGFASVLYRIALKKAGKVFFENEENAREFMTRKIVSRDRLSVFAGAGVNLQQYPREEYPTNDRVRFLYLGRIMYEKGVEELFCAMRKLHEELGDRVALDLVGFFDDDCEQQVRALEAEGIAVFHGFQTDPRPFYKGADCVVLPSYHEGMSNVLLEASATGRPVITSNIPGCREAVEPDISGFLCVPKDAYSLYQQMRRMAELTREQREEMGHAARMRIERCFDREDVVRKTVEALGL